MKLPRVSIAGMMAAVAVVALDCFALITTGGAGVLLIGLILSVGFACWWRGHGRGRRFWLGFEVAGLVTVLVYVFFARSNDELIAEWPMYVLDLGLKRSPLLVGFWTSLSKQQSQIAGLVVFEMFYAPLMALVASLGGMFAIMIGSSPRKKERAAQPS